MASPVTQIVYLSIGTDKEIGNIKCDAGKKWSEALDILEAHEGFRRLYWGRSPEDMTKVQLHVVRDQLSHHESFEKSPKHASFLSLISTLITPSTKPFTRHVHMREFTPHCQALGKGAPFTGTAVYIQTTDAWHEGAWPLWTHVVRHVDGCLGCAGGKVLEPVHGKYNNCYVVYVGWETIEKHDAYHHTEHFDRHRVILGIGNEGWREYGHVKFEGVRESVGHRL